MKARTIVGLFNSAFLAYATASTPSLAPDDAKHPVPTPTRQLTWGDVNVLHTTDIHGWALGHSKKVYPERSWSGTFGDLYSFVHHMRAKAKDEKKDILLVDTGDRRTGSGLTDRNSTGVNGQFVSELYLQLGYDAVVPGNHDLKSDTVVEYTIKRLAGLWGDRYLTSNVELTQTTPVDRNRVAVPGAENLLGQPYRYWTTENQKRVLAFGVIPGPRRDGEYSPLIKVTNTTDMVEKDWFKRALEKPVDLFLILGHVDPKKDDFAANVRVIHKAIRDSGKHPNTPIMMFGGHTHERNCVRLDKQSMFLQSGNYFNTVGWMSTELNDNSSKTMTRRYLDNNIQTYMFHAGKNESNFHTNQGQAITDSLYRVEREAGLSQVYGYLESDYFLDRTKWSEDKNSNKNSLFDFYLDAVEKTLIPDNMSDPWMFVGNWGILRGDIYAGPFTLGDMYTISPDDPGEYLYARVDLDVADSIAQKLIDMKSAGRKAPSQDTKPFHSRITNRALSNDDPQIRFSLGAPTEPNGLTYGFVTKDTCGPEFDKVVVGEGDDVPHLKVDRVPFNAKENYFGYFWRKSWREGSAPAPNKKVVLIFTNYLGNGVAQDALGKHITLQEFNSNVTESNLLGLYVRKHHNKITGNIPFPE